MKVLFGKHLVRASIAAFLGGMMAVLRRTPAAHPLPVACIFATAFFSGALFNSVARSWVTRRGSARYWIVWALTGLIAAASGLGISTFVYSWAPNEKALFVLVLFVGGLAIGIHEWWYFYGKEQKG